MAAHPIDEKPVRPCFLRLLPWFWLGSPLSDDPGSAIGVKI